MLPFSPSRLTLGMQTEMSTKKDKSKKKTFIVIKLIGKFSGSVQHN